MSLRVIGHPVAIELSFSLYPELRDQVAAWYVDDELVDAGGEHTAVELLDWLGERPVEALYLGHSHEDHSAGAPALAERGIPVRGSRGTAARLRRPAKVPDFRAKLWGQPRTLRITPPDGGRLVSVPLPGHAPDQLGYLHPQSGWLFSGDLILRKRQRFAMPGEDPYQMMRSLRSVRALKPAALATSHRGLILEPEPALQEQIDYLEGLAAQITSLHGRGAPIAQIVREALGGEPLVSGQNVTWRQWTRGRFSAARWVRAFLSESSA